MSQHGLLVWKGLREIAQEFVQFQMPQSSKRCLGIVLSMHKIVTVCRPITGFLQGISVPTRSRVLSTVTVSCVLRSVPVWRKLWIHPHIQNNSISQAVHPGSQKQTEADCNFPIWAYQMPLSRSRVNETTSPQHGQAANWITNGWDHFLCVNRYWPPRKNWPFLHPWKVYTWLFMSLFY